MTRHHPAETCLGVEQPEVEHLVTDLLDVIRMGPGLPGHEHDVDAAGREALVLGGDIGLEQLDLVAQALLEDARGELGDQLGIGPGGPADPDGLFGRNGCRESEGERGGEQEPGQGVSGHGRSSSWFTGPARHGLPDPDQGDGG